MLQFSELEFSELEFSELEFSELEFSYLLVMRRKSATRSVNQLTLTNTN